MLEKQDRVTMYSYLAWEPIMVEKAMGMLEDIKGNMDEACAACPSKDVCIDIDRCKESEAIKSFMYKVAWSDFIAKN